MIKQVTIASGKGGTGKTTVVASLAGLVRPVVTADCDVDAANLALLLPGRDRWRQQFFAGQRARVDAGACTGCGTCVCSCRFGAIDLGPEMTAVVDPISCEGCGVCRTVCPEGAVEMDDNLAGQLMLRDTSAGPLVHARLGIAQDNSGKLVAAVRARAREEAAARGLDLVLVDGPPGIGCPVHAAVTGADLLLAVTEPTPSGVHDLQRLLELARTFRLPAAVLINKADLSPRYAGEVERLGAGMQTPIVGRLPFDPQVPRLLARGQAPLVLERWAAALREIWPGVQRLAGAPPTYGQAAGGLGLQSR
jgi:MinD superfamily P-loop ATPase